MMHLSAKHAFCRSLSGRLARAAAALLAGLALAPALEAQVRKSTFEETTEVIEVQVPVNVIGRDGEPVRGLTAESFEVLDEGEPREVTDLRVVDLALIEPDGDSQIPSSARRHVLLLFDLSFSSPSAVVRARQAAQRFVLEALHPTDLAGVAVQTVDSGTRLVVTFTPDRAQLARAIDTLGAPRLLDRTIRDPLRFLIDNPLDLDGMASNDSGQGRGLTQNLGETVMQHLQVIGQQMARTEKSFARGRVSSWSRSMGDLARMLGSVEGRKHVVYFSEGFDGRLLFGRAASGDDPDVQQDMLNIGFGEYWMVDMDDFYGNSGLQSDVRVMLEEFRRNDCIIQAVDISGLTAGTAEAERIHSVGQDALFYLANDTGGELYEEANNFGEELVKVLDRSSVTYLLSFEPSGLERDGSFHRLKVKVADAPRGARVSHRMGYYAPRPYEELHPLEKNLLASDAIASAAPRHDVNVDVLTAAFRASDDMAYVPVIVEVEGASLLAGHSADTLSVELYTYVTDEAGQIRDFFTQMISLDLGRSRSAFSRTGLKYYGHLDLPAGRYLVRVLVRNAFTGRTGVETAALEVPGELEAQPSLLPPFFLEEPGSWFLVREKQGEGFQRSVIYPFTVNGDPYIPSARPALASHQEARFCLVAYNLGGELLLDGQVLGGDGEVILDGGEISLVERTVTGIDGLDKLLATFRPNGLDPGDYTLRVALRDPVAGLLGTNSIPFRIQ